MSPPLLGLMLVTIVLLGAFFGIRLLTQNLDPTTERPLLQQKKFWLVVFNVIGMICIMIIMSFGPQAPSDGGDGSPGDGFYYLIFVLPVLALIALVNLIALIVAAFAKRGNKVKVLKIFFGLCMLWPVALFLSMLSA